MQVCTTPRRPPAQREPRAPAKRSRVFTTVTQDQLLATIEATIRAHDVLRLKGFAALPGASARLAIQAVGPRVTAYFDRSWRLGEARETALVVIGQSPLDRAGISAALGAAAGAAN